jgi:hypothetical protein
MALCFKLWNPARTFSKVFSVHTKVRRNCSGPCFVLIQTYSYCAYFDSTFLLLSIISDQSFKRISQPQQAATEQKTSLHPTRQQLPSAPHDQHGLASGAPPFRTTPPPPLRFLSPCAPDASASAAGAGTVLCTAHRRLTSCPPAPPSSSDWLSTTGFPKNARGTLDCGPVGRRAPQRRPLGLHRAAPGVERRRLQGRR